MKNKLTKCRKNTICCNCSDDIKRNELCHKFKVDEETLHLCVDCVNTQHIIDTECKQGRHSFNTHHFEPDWEGYVLYPNYTGEMQCDYCGEKQ